MSETVETIRLEQPRDPRGLPKLVVFIDSGKPRSQGEGNFFNRIEVYRSNVFTGATDENPYGTKTDLECYRINLGARANNKLGLSVNGVNTLIAALERLKKEFPLASE